MIYNISRQHENYLVEWSKEKKMGQMYPIPYNTVSDLDSALSDSSWESVIAFLPPSSSFRSISYHWPLLTYAE